MCALGLAQLGFKTVCPVRLDAAHRDTDSSFTLHGTLIPDLSQQDLTAGPTGHIVKLDWQDAARVMVSAGLRLRMRGDRPVPTSG